MYKVIIVDDEFQLREKLLTLLKKHKKIEVIAQYDNGIDALEGIIANNPDIVITDIKMPYLTGIELIEQAKEHLPFLKSIIISGFDVFHYAKKALQLEVVGFLTKPIDKKELYKDIDKAILKIEKEQSYEENLNKLKLFHESNINIIYESLFNKLLREDSINKPFKERLTNANILLDYKNFIITVFDFNSTPKLDPETLLFGILEYIKEYLKDDIKYDFTIKNEKLVILFKLNIPINIEYSIVNILKKIKRFYNQDVSAGISKTFDITKSFREHYDQAIESLTYRKILKNSDNIYKYIDELKEVNYNVDQKLLKNISYNLMYETYENNLVYMNKIYDILLVNENRNFLHIIIINILNEILKGCRDFNQLNKHLNNSDDLYKKAINLKTKDEIISFFNILIKNVFSVNENTKDKISNMQKNKIIDYIENNYNSYETNMEKASNDMGISISYIAQLLREDNKTFNNLLTDKRIKVACDLLKNSNLKIIEISESIGYQDPYYFSHSFKKKMGVSPREFRQTYEKK